MFINVSCLRDVLISVTITCIFGVLQLFGFGVLSVLLRISTYFVLKTIKSSTLGLVYFSNILIS